MRRSWVIIGRICTVLAATCMVGAFALAALLPPLTPLGEALFTLDDTLLPRMQNGMHAIAADRLWEILVVPLLSRPAWFLPLALSIVFAGLAVSLRRPASPPRPRLRE